jgi:hypothetical protein
MAEAGPVFEIEVNVEGDRAVAGRPMVLNVSGKGRRRSSDTRGETPRAHGIPQVLKELLTSHRPRMFSHDSPSSSAEYIPSPHTGEETSDYPEREDVKVCFMCVQFSNTATYCMYDVCFSNTTAT